MDGQATPTLLYDNETSAHKNIREDRCNIVSNQRQSGDVVGSEVSSHSNSRSMPRMSDTNTVSPTRRTHRFCCPHPSCTDRSFGRRSDRDRHVRKHSMTERTYACPQSEWEKRFYRKDKLLDHTRHGHRPKKAACTCSASRWWNAVELGHPKRRTLSTGCSTECVSEVLWWTHYLRRLSSLDPSFLLSDFYMILAILNGAVLLCYGSPGYYVIFRFPLF